MRFSLDSALIVLTLAHALVTPVSANEDKEPKRHALRRASRGFHRSALRHSAGLARDLRVALRGLGSADTARAPVAARNTLANKPYCVYHTGGQTNTSVNTNPFGHPGHSSASSKPSATRSSTTSPTSSPAGQSNFHLAQSYSGSSFFSGWNFFTGGDPTNGVVQYVDQQTATSSNLVSINSAGNAIMRVDNTSQVSGNRNSVRIQTQFTFTGGLLVMDSVHMPTGCGTWPAFWTVGPNWPVEGEIDIVEGVNNYTNNQATIHANTGCQLPTSNVTALGISGSVVGGTNCAALQTNNEGCGVRASQTNSFGEPFNNNGGGVFAMLWDNTGVSVYFFDRQNIPSDITAQAPVPEGWGTPSAFWPASGCNPFQFFQNHAAVFDTTLCGDWAGGVWTATGVPGQDQSCAQRTGVATCQQFVQQNGAALSEAYWEVKGVQIYQSN
ncbi:concanavalin A-like lectin/glucanase domain-containing protein [Russula ochroleuca]|uniref:Concanavalin A-like lectin/glucanase domain-containing protein n=1 Tax=Russula ochroleuca TaxID=152965 RepID=A0A9P5T9Y6_9AGAM|nr:concanavalin A-like lectin/glucanase domain-containing protein [Russula ochroleuca]